MLFFSGVITPCLHCANDPRLMLQCKSYRRLRDPTSEWSFRGETARFTDFCLYQHRWREVQLTADVPPSAAHRLATASAVERKPAGDEKEGGGGGGGSLTLASKRGCVMERGSWLGAEYGRNSGVIGL